MAVDHSGGNSASSLKLVAASVCAVWRGVSGIVMLAAPALRSSSPCRCRRLRGVESRVVGTGVSGVHEHGDACTTNIYLKIETDHETTLELETGWCKVVPQT